MSHYTSGLIFYTTVCLSFFLLLYKDNGQISQVYPESQSLHRSERAMEPNSKSVHPLVQVDRLSPFFRTDGWTDIQRHDASSCDWGIKGRVLHDLLRLSPRCGVVNWNGQDTAAGCWCAPPSVRKVVLYHTNNRQCLNKYTSDKEHLLSSSDWRTARIWLLHLGLYLYKSQ